MIYDLVR